MSLVVKEMCIYTEEDLHRLQHSMYLTFLEEPRLYFDEAAERCNASRNTLSKYWWQGIDREVFFPPQVRLNMYENRKEYIYLIQSDSAHKLYTYFQQQKGTVYTVYGSGKFEILLQTNQPLEVLPDRTLLQGSRSNYIYPLTPYCSYEDALKRMDMLSEQEQKKSKIKVEYPKEPPEKGSSHYGWMIYPYVKYNLTVGFTKIIKTLHISFPTFFKGLDYLLNVSTVLLPYYPYGFRLYSQYFFVFWTDYEEFLCKFFGQLPCHTSITKVNDALVMLVSVQKKERFSEKMFQLCFKLVDLGLIDHFWNSRPVYHWIPDIP